jgi:four helix bundle protein
LTYDLEQRLIDFAVKILDITEMLPNSNGGNYFAGQLVRSGSAPALMYGEAQSAESRRDFVHKMKLALKELRETFVGLRIVMAKRYLNNEDNLKATIAENNELISIFVKSISTASKKL